jgi:hypothetical protein
MYTLLIIPAATCCQIYCWHGLKHQKSSYYIVVYIMACWVSSLAILRLSVRFGACLMSNDLKGWLWTRKEWGGSSRGILQCIIQEFAREPEDTRCPGWDCSRIIAEHKPDAFRHTVFITEACWPRNDLYIYLHSDVKYPIGSTMNGSCPALI